MSEGPVVTPEVTYADATAGITWLTDVLGLEPTLVVPDDDGTILHAELAWRDGFVFVGSKDDEDGWNPGAVQRVPGRRVGRGRRRHARPGPGPRGRRGHPGG